MEKTNLNIRGHLLELRKRLTYCALSILICTIAAFVFHQQILEIMMGPAEKFSGIPNTKPIYTELTEFIGIATKASLLVGLFLSLPFVLFQIVLFVSPGLTKKERRYLYAIVPIGTIAFILGASFGYFVLLPPVVKFLTTFGSDIAEPLIRIGNYVNLMLTLLFWMGVVFEMPLVFTLLAKIGILNPQILSKNRRYAVVIAFVLGAIITPTFDPINQTIVALPIIVLYEISIWMSKLAYSKKSAN